MRKGENSRNKLASSSDATAAGGGSSSPALTPERAADVFDVDAEKKAVGVILPAPVYNSRTGDMYELPAETIKAVENFPVSTGFWREGEARSLVYVLDWRIRRTDRREDGSLQETILLSKRILPSAEDGDK